MAIELVVQQWRHYLLGQTNQADQHSLKHLVDQRDIPQKFQKWIIKLLGYDFKIQYNLSLTNKATDAFSPILESIELSTLTIPSIIDVCVIGQEVNQDSQLQQIVQTFVRIPSM